MYWGGGGGLEQKGGESSVFEPLVRCESFNFHTWLVYKKDGNFMYCKICAKAYKYNGMSKESQAEIFELLRCFDMRVFKNTKWLVYMLFVLKGTRRMFIDLRLALLALGLVVYRLCESQDSLQPFPSWTIVPRVARLEASKVKFVWSLRA